ncbi:MAG TPA: hypothetical protein VKD08_07760 [Ignavibacteriaceae bacterium]|jgi:division protein CdvB (Snf7/Vps24/ESCRT-III family)|nr:hypothetical protein [Ignavibacteriaceae bacterium]
MLAFQDEEIMNGEKKIREWQSKFVSLQGKLDNTMDNIPDQFEKLLLRLDEMKIKVEELKNPGRVNFEKIKGEIKDIDNKIDAEYRAIQKNLYS